MPAYYLLHDPGWFHGQFRPALATSWFQRSFTPCQRLCADLVPAAEEFAQRYRLGAEEPLLVAAARGLPYDRHLWRYLVGEILLIGATHLPEIRAEPDTLRCLLAPEVFESGRPDRDHFPWIDQAHFGTHDLTFAGKPYRPEQVGYNDVADAQRISHLLEGVDPSTWALAGLEPVPGVTDEEERAEELEYARERFAELRALYQEAAGQGRVLVCEVLS